VLPSQKIAIAPNLQKMKPPTRLSLKKLIYLAVQIFERLDMGGTRKGQGKNISITRNMRFGN